jgi:hypothetical protein
MTKHTTAPWLIGENRFDYDLIIRSANNDPVCSVIYAGYSKTEAKANARLIAAAPELLEALKEICDCPQWVDEATVPKAGIEAAPQQVVVNMSVALVRLRKAKTAIAKAEVTK